MSWNGYCSHIGFGSLCLKWVNIKVKIKTNSQAQSKDYLGMPPVPRTEKLLFFSTLFFKLKALFFMLNEACLLSLVHHWRTFKLGPEHLKRAWLEHFNKIWSQTSELPSRIRLLNELNPLVASNSSIFGRAWRLIFSLSSFVHYS